MSIPLVEIGALMTPESFEAPMSPENAQVVRCVEAIMEALGEVGFLAVKGHGVDVALQEELEALARGFFGRPEEEKMAIRMENAGLWWKGYFAPGAELTSGRPDRKEGLYFGTELSREHPAVRRNTPMHGPNQWPPGDDGRFRAVVLAYMDAMSRLARRLLEAIALGLGLEAGYFAGRFGDEATRLFRIFHYPPHTWADEEDEWGVRAHTDMGFLTILRQDMSGGLQVQDRHGRWLDAPPIENTFVVNIGDMLELWTWGILKANLHRVKNPSAAGRLSFPFFFDPAWDGSLERIDRSAIKAALLRDAVSTAEQRWDGLDLAKISHETTYGDFVWAKISRVFPQLVP